MADPPRFPLLLQPTPYQPAPRLAAALGLGRLHVKREDLAGPALGGSKIRSLELILGAARAARADSVLAAGASQSHFCRALAGCAPRAGLACHLLLHGAQAPLGNLLLCRLFGADIGFTDASDPAIRAQLETRAAALRLAGGNPFLVHLAGETAPLAAAAWALAAEEMAADFEAAGSAPDLLVLACGAGLSLAGLALGFARYGLPVRLLGVSVRQPAARLRPWVEQVAARAAALLGWDEPAAMAAVTLTDDQRAPDHDGPGAPGLAAVHLAARTEGLVLDPAASAKALAGLAAAVGGLVPRGGAAALVHSGGAAALVHSGGLPGLLADSDAVAVGLARG
ncbi:pyridoxal-phosphate dependent enzyme [Falsiroseomonas selenitidurans]|uniref:Pyridoxal-phosphate dependent enzyme n=1 Tax=Falsiroseomonas selenitidurans TaxID=2716335 RepID=A0ABX1E4Z0_9PROT|nr:pyridoxal-phosphate dependent enzyme [Falsiroseomonas selenitidurans]NKC30837.1 pyridoxal-phosphate dependent enzyme [Falsiroseomonas selenitidurans]